MIRDKAIVGIKLRYSTSRYLGSSKNQPCATFVSNTDQVKANY